MNTINSRSALIEWNPPSENKANGIIKYYIMRLYENDTSLHYEYQANNDSFFVNGLHPYYTYSVSVAAMTIRIGPYSNNISFTTLEDSKFIFIKIIYLL